MKANSTILMLTLLLGTCCFNLAQGLYFYMERDIQKCFKDELVKNSVFHNPRNNNLTLENRGTCQNNGRGSERSHAEQ